MQTDSSAPATMSVENAEIPTSDLPPSAEPRCSRFTIATGEDPVGTASGYRRYLLIEVPTPWRSDVWQSKYVPSGVIAARKRAVSLGKELRFLAVVPEPKYARPGFTRVLDFRRPENAFARFQRDEFLVLHEAVGDLVNALVGDSAADLEPFAVYRDGNSDVRDLLVCSHGSHDACCGTFGFRLYRTLQPYSDDPAGNLRIWRVSHIGGHRFAPTVIDFPEARYWAHLDAETAELLIRRDRPVERLRSHYRGWGGLGPFEQIVEREIFIREGWAWKDFLKTGQVLEAASELDFDPEALIDPVFAEQPVRRVTVRIAYRSPDHRRSGTYEATIALSGSMRGRGECGEPCWERNTYRVTRLEEMSDDAQTRRLIVSLA